jgi:hypothetical protein
MNSYKDIDRFIKKAHDKSPKESDIVRQILDWLNEYVPDPKLIMKIHGSRWQMAGVPDIQMYWIGTSWSFEVKTKKNVASPIQKARIHSLRLSGNHAWVVRSLDQVREIMLHHMYNGVLSCYSSRCDGLDTDVEIR